MLINKTSILYYEGMTDENNTPIKEINIIVRVSMSTGGPKSNSPIILVSEISKEENDFILWVYDLNYYHSHKSPKYIPALGGDAPGGILGFVTKYLKGKDRLVYM